MAKKMDSRDAIIMALCAKLGVDASAIMQECEGNAGANAGKEDAKEGKTISLSRKCITTEWPEKCEYKEGKIS